MRLAGLATCVAVSAMAAIATALLLGRMWSACDVGINSAANSTALVFFYIPVVFAVTAVFTGLAYAVVQRLSSSTTFAVSSAVVVSIAVVWVALALLHGDDYPSPICTDNLPPWWPNWIPL
jgi:hypothetical protein